MTTSLPKNREEEAIDRLESLKREFESELKEAMGAKRITLIN